MLDYSSITQVLEVILERIQSSDSPPLYVVPKNIVNSDYERAVIVIGNVEMGEMNQIDREFIKKG